MSNEKLIPDYTPPTYAQSQPPPHVHTYATAPPPYQGAVAPEYPYQHQPTTTTRTVIVTERTVPATQVYVNPLPSQIVVNPFLWIYVLLSILFCPIFGCIALCFLIMASSDQDSGRYSQAIANARIARIFAGFGIMMFVLIVAINLVLNFTVYQKY